MNAQELTAIRRLVATRPLREFRLVVRPDHPLVFRGPDVLLGGLENLSAVFVPTRDEERNPARLAARLIATRLAYPGDTRCFLIGAQEYTHPHLNRDFDASFVLDDHRAVEVIADVRATRERPPMSDPVRKEVIVRFDRALRASVLSYKWRRRQGHTESEAVEDASLEIEGSLNKSPWVMFRDYHLRQANRYLYGDVPLVVAQTQSREKMLREVRSAADSQFVADFDLDNGVPYLRSQAHFAVLIADHWAKKFDETSKPVLAAAFAGIAIAPSSDRDTLDNFIQRIPRLTGAIEYEEEPWVLDRD